ncbi:hypothetical protein HanRHA438_Chr13g0580511 [Helianthus annuus]|nr:hypothetical protein HanIR_Chr13g0619941 [Helianthus annuus]KAJ0662382.1 hypothetical protein HanLR1_Chr13g0468821 [Helianthus annuus]KAJ0669907.1 hypothetical protein HanOQP8_Chr13g0467891 [Helianthus annuus]KAJ0847690.1 hypothetical protein HanPSC8_Chr13g0548161 [Helianthus annuus]KAJ0856622.1 hypothetical protein HanRHA438_Chr13g0580511 [Helianthus annuus]
MSGGGLFLQTQNHPLKVYFVLLRWTSPPPPPEPGLVDHCKPPSEPALPEKSGGPGGLDVDGCFCWLTSIIFFDVFCDYKGPILQAVPCGSRLVMPHGADRFIGKDDDGVARTVDGRFLNQQPEFYNNDYWKL